MMKMFFIQVLECGINRKYATSPVKVTLTVTVTVGDSDSVTAYMPLRLLPRSINKTCPKPKSASLNRCVLG
jgi:hypothetical protein